MLALARKHHPKHSLLTCLAACSASRPLTFVPALGPRRQPPIHRRRHEQVVALLARGNGAAAGCCQRGAGAVCRILLGTARKGRLVAAGS